MKLVAALLILLAAGWTACEPSDWGPDKLGLGHTSPEVSRLKVGRETYATYCAG